MTRLRRAVAVAVCACHLKVARALRAAFAASHGARVSRSNPSLVPGGQEA